MDEHTGVHVAVGVDVEVPPSAGDAAAYEFAVVLEVHGEDGLGFADVANLVVHVFPLLGGGQQLGGRVVAHGHVVEIPDELGAPVDHVIHELVGSDGVDVLAGVAAAQAEGKALVLQNLHGMDDLLIGAQPRRPSVASQALDADGGHEVAHFQHLVGKGPRRSGCRW